MQAMVDAYYGGSVSRLARLRSEFGADVLVVGVRTFRSRRPAQSWRHSAPYTQRIAHLLKVVPHFAVLQLPGACRIWQQGDIRIYDLGCVSRSLDPSLG